MFLSSLSPVTLSPLFGEVQAPLVVIGGFAWDPLGRVSGSHWRSFIGCFCCSVPACTSLQFFLDLQFVGGFWFVLRGGFAGSAVSVAAGHPYAGFSRCRGLFRSPESCQNFRIFLVFCLESASRSPGGAGCPFGPRLRFGCSGRWLSRFSGLLVYRFCLSG